MDKGETALAEQACAAVSTRFFHHLDRREYDQVAALMGENGVWNRQSTPLHGRIAVLETLLARPPGLTTRHLLSNIVVDMVDAANSRVSYELSVFVHDGADPARQTLMTGEDRLERDGTSWRIRLKDARVLFRLTS